MHNVVKVTYKERVERNYSFICLTLVLNHTKTIREQCEVCSLSHASSVAYRQFDHLAATSIKYSLPGNNRSINGSLNEARAHKAASVRPPPLVIHGWIERAEDS